MNSSPNRWLYVLAAALILAVVLLSMPIATDLVPEVSYSELKELVERGQVEEVAFRGSEVTAKLSAPLPLGPGGQKTFAVHTYVPTFGGERLLPLLEEKSVRVRTQPAEPGGLAALLSMLLPWLILIGIYWLFWRRVWRSMGGPFGGRGVQAPIPTSCSRTAASRSAAASATGRRSTR